MVRAVVAPARRAELQRALMLLLWLGGVVRIFVDSPALTWTLVVGLGVFLAVGLPWTASINRIIAGGACAVFLGVSALTGNWPAVLDGLAFSLVFIGFLPTLQLIRRTLEASPETAQSRDAFAAMSLRARNTGVMAGAHVVGSVLTLGVFPIVAPLIPDGSAPEARRELARATMRGVGLVIHWSPFTVGMGFALAFRPDVALWQAVAAGLVLALAGIALAIVVFDRKGGLWSLIDALLAFRPLLWPLLSAMLLVVAVASIAPLSTIEAVVLTMPALCLAWVLSKGGALVPAVARATYQGLPRLADDFLIFVAAVTLGKVLAATPALMTLLTAPAIMALPTPVVLAGFMTIALILPFLGLPALVSASVLLPILEALAGRLADIVAVQALLFAWCCGSMLSVASMAMVVARSLFRVPLGQLLFPHNALFMVAYGVLAFVMLTATNAALVD